MAAVFGIAVNPAALAAVSGIQVEEVTEFVCDWMQLKLVYQAGELWAVPSYIRDKLLAFLKPEERRSAQKAAGEFLRVLAEEGKAAEIGLSRLDLMLEGARPLYRFRRSVGSQGCEQSHQQLPGKARLSFAVDLAKPGAFEPGEAC